MKKTGKKRLRLVIGGVLLFLGFLLLFASLWSLQTFGDVPFEQIMYHLRMPLKGSDSNTISSFIFTCIPATLVCTALFFVPIMNFEATNELVLTWGKRQRRVKLFPSPWWRRYFALIAAIVFVIATGVAVIVLHVVEYISLQLSPTTIYEDYYIDADHATLVFPEEKRNLIYINLESMESSYTSDVNGGAQPINYIPNLTELAKENTNFSNSDAALGGARELNGTQWTVASLVAQTSGVPLRSPVGRNNMGKYEAFLPGVYTLGEVLEDEGYNQMLMVGSDIAFAGRDTYFSAHGNYEIFDYYTAIELGLVEEGYYHSKWGIEDIKLFSYAKKALLELAEEDEPFNFTMLTVDTHFPDGDHCIVCPDKFDSQYGNVIYCSDRQVKNFINWIQDQDFYENTTIIITGDHITMDTNFYANIDENYIRTTYNAIINAPVEARNTKNRQFTSTDMFPTTLAALGVDIDGDRLGLGTNLYSDRPTLLEELGYDLYFSEMEKNSSFYNKVLLLGQGSPLEP